MNAEWVFFPMRSLFRKRWVIFLFASIVVTHFDFELHAQGQTPRKTGKVTLQPPAQATIKTVAAQSSPGELSGGEGGYKLQWPNFPLDLIVLEYEKLTEKKVIVDVNVIGSTMTISTSLSLTKSEAITFIEKSLLLNGYAFVPSGDDTVKLIAIGGGKDPRSEGVPFFTDAEKLPDTDQVVSFVMEFTYIQPVEAAAIFERVIPLHAYGQLTPVEGTSVMLLSENASTIRSMVSLKDKIDVPPTETERKSFQLERADAEVVAEHLNQLLGAQNAINQARTTPTSSRANTIRQGAGAAANRRAVPRTPNAANQGLAGSFHIIAVRRTNRILAIARPLDMVYIESLVEEFDAPASVQTFLKRPLNYISVEEFFPIIADALSRGADDGAGSGGQGRQANSQPRRPTNTSSRSGAGGGTLSGGVSLGEPEDTGSPQSMIVGKTLLISNPEDNSILVSGPPEHLEIVKELLSQMDVKPRQIYLSTVIGQLTIGDDLNYGIDIVRTVDDFQLDQNSFRGAGSFFTRGDTGAAIDPDLLTQVADFPSTAGISVYGKFNDKLSAYISALESTNRFKILSRPSLVTRNNKKAVISVGEQVPVPSQTLTNLNGGGIVNPGSVTSNITFRDVVLKLEIIPLINSDNEVTLQVAQVNDNIVSTIVIGGNEVPVIGTQELTTTVTVPNRDTVLLGGLISESDSESHNGMPWLSRVPIIRHLVGTTQKNVRRQELLIFIQPFIINDDADLAEVHLDMTRRTEISEEGIEFAIPEVKIEREKEKRPWFRWLKKKQSVAGEGAFSQPSYRNTQVPRAIEVVR